MEQGRTRFYEFMERVKDEYRDDAAKMLAESFVLQQEGRLDASFMKKFQDAIMMYLKPEYTDEVMNIMQNFKD